MIQAANEMVEERKPYWSIPCSHCGQHFVHNFVDMLHPREAPDALGHEPCKPRFVHGRKNLLCPHCDSWATYRHSQLTFHLN